MTTVLPISEFRQHQFKCPNPKCFLTHWFTDNMLSSGRTVVTCDCKTVFRPRLSMPEKKSKNKINPKPNNRNYDITVTMMQVYGKSEEEAKEIVNEVFDDSITLEELIEKAVNHVRGT